MKIDLHSVRTDENFMVHEHFIGDTPVYLVQPVHIGSKFTSDNLIFRSSVWTKDGFPVSLSFKKFANFGEKPEVFPVPTSLDGTEAREKIDGSTLCVSTFKDTLVIRTRGTVDALKQDTGPEITWLTQKYPLAFNNSIVKSGDFTVVFEFCSPTNRIVLDYGPEPLIYLTAIISHKDYSYAPQDALDTLAVHWNVLRPRKYTFNTLLELQEAVKAFRGVEGVCLYYDGGQRITKLKGDEYLFLHRAKSDISSLDKVIDLYLSQYSTTRKFLDYNEFFSYLEKSFDYEIAVMAKNHIQTICSAINEVRVVIGVLTTFTSQLIGKSRKNAAEAIMQSHGKNCSVAFHLLDGKSPTVAEIKKMLIEVIERT